MRFGVILFVIAVALGGCLPKDTIEVRDVKNVMMIPGTTPTLTGDVLFYNPNSTRMKLRAINVDIYVDGKKSATVDDKVNIVARPKSEFTIPIKVKMDVEGMGLMNTIKSLFGGKKYDIHYKGHLKVNVNGFPVRVPIDHHEEFKLGF